jgi:prepilin-type processing-associated H-X9-DG protein
MGQPFEPGPSERAIFADATISEGHNEQNRAANEYNKIQGGWTSLHTSSHLNGRFPAGGNISMLDGHTEWRNFKLQHVRTDGSEPTFWW